MNYHEIVASSCCEPRLAGRTRDEALASLAELAVRSPVLSGVDARDVFAALREREDQGSTGFGNEVALPHARIPGMSSFLVFTAISRRGVSFDALDRKKVRLFFVILGPPEEVTPHLRILAGISRAMGHTPLKKELLAARSSDALAETMLRHLGENTGGPSSQDREVMKLLFVNLYVEEYLYEVMGALVEGGIEGATILDSTGMGQYVSSVPLFAEFIGFMKENRNFSKTILAMVPERDISRTVERIEEITGNLDTHDGAVILVMDVARYRGSMKMM